MTINTVDELRAAIKSLPVPSYEYRAPDGIREKYIVWGCTAAGEPFWADDECLYYRLRGELWYYSTEAMDKTVNDIVSTLLLGGADCIVREIGYDDDLAQVVHVMDWSIICGGSAIY